MKKSLCFNSLLFVLAISFSASSQASDDIEGFGGEALAPKCTCTYTNILKGCKKKPNGTVISYDWGGSGSFSSHPINCKNLEKRKQGETVSECGNSPKYKGLSCST